LVENEAAECERMESEWMVTDRQTRTSKHVKEKKKKKKTEKKKHFGSSACP